MTHRYHPPSRSPERRREREHVRKYGLSSEVYQEMLSEQGGRCAICRRKVRLHVDHDHQSGVVRGLLCFQCNVGLGGFRDNPVLLKRAVKYLMEE